MTTDPRKDPNRRCRPIEAWPTIDRCARDAAMSRGDIIEPGDGGTGWAPLSRRKIAKAMHAGSFGWNGTGYLIL
jgi:hypothetical protein